MYVLFLRFAHTQTLYTPKKRKTDAHSGEKNPNFSPHLIGCRNNRYDILNTYILDEYYITISSPPKYWGTAFAATTMDGGVMEDLTKFNTDIMHSPVGPGSKPFNVGNGLRFVLQ